MSLIHRVPARAALVPRLSWGVFLAFLLGIGSLRGEEPATAPDGPPATESTTAESVAGKPEVTLESLQTETAAAALAGHNAWMLTCSALVLFMTAPGLAMFYGGLVRKKNVLSILMQCLFLMGLMTVIWALYGYSLAFGDPDSAGLKPYIGDADFLFMSGVSRTWDAAANAPVDPPLIGLIPRSTHMLFQGMFFIITPALICGAFAERMKFSAMVLFSVLWGTVVYCPLCHWVWGGGLLAYVPASGVTPLWGGALDFAGGTVVHISSGLCVDDWQTDWLWTRRHASPQFDLHSARRCHAVGGLVRLQCGQ
jgi:Amt family ammonium transporter